MILGNHEFVLVQGLDDSDLRSGLPTLSRRPSTLYSDDLTAHDIEFLAGLPRWLRLDLPVGICTCFHGTPVSLFAKGIGADVGAWRRALATTAPADVVFVGHTHMPFELRVESSRVVNPGSVGLPADGDPRAAFAEIEGNTIALRRTEYPVEDAVRAVERSALTIDETEALVAWLRTGSRRPRSHSRLDFGVRRHIDGAGAREAAADA
jgi:diadenosine tetraphosphatase ApaH/serine/threonine PP2A family protein phosphatase